MSSDNVYEVVEALIESDKRQLQIPEPVDAILTQIAKIPGAAPLIKAVRYQSEKQRVENTQLMLTTMWEELKRISLVIDERTEEEVGKLVIDGMRKAEDLRDRKRVERIGKILAHSVAIGPASDFDKAEEMMRVARDLSDLDVRVLRHMYDSQFQSLSQMGWQIIATEVNTLWREHPLKVAGEISPEVDSVLLKLQGLGLITTVERVPSQVGPDQRPFGLLLKGADFVHYAKGTAK